MFAYDSIIQTVCALESKILQQEKEKMPTFTFSNVYILLFIRTAALI